MALLVLGSNHAHASSFTAYAGPGCSGNSEQLNRCGCSNINRRGGYVFTYTGQTAAMYNQAGCTGVAHTRFGSSARGCSPFGWQSITCDGVTGYVTSLDLSELRIYGRIDFVSLFRLPSLQRLNLAYHYFDSSPFDPSGFEHLTSLTHLNLSYLHFYGQIPLEISRMTTLVSLDLSFNTYYEYLKLENPNIGAFVQNLSSLKELHLDWINISAEGSGWGLALSSALPRLRKLSLRGCGLSGPIHSSLSSLCFLSQLDLRGNDLSSVVPNLIGNFSSLTSLALSDCGLHGKIPESIFRLPNLQTLDVGSNPLLTGEIPPNNTLREWSLSDTGFCSNLRDSFSNSKLLTMIHLSHCKLAGQFPS
ncbi:receptor-like protein 6 [Magnolia sinica]|uniref:receptor-like protein 6 n=1 Tax=Magnolia sinica TaxID=86752 RepID=UPI00265A02BE|nr:receptor-like protein 6 [Magnolia sinica]